MDLDPIANLFNYQRQTNWPDRAIVYGVDECVLAISVGTEDEPVLIRVVVRTDVPVVEVVRSHNAHTGVSVPLGQLCDRAVLARVGGTLIKVSNVVDQCCGLIAAARGGAA